MISDDEKSKYATDVRADCDRVCTFLLGFEMGLRLDGHLDADALAVCAASRRLNKGSLDLVFAFDQAGPTYAGPREEEVSR